MGIESKEKILFVEIVLVGMVLYEKDEIKKYLDKDLEFNYNSRGACFLSSICVVGYDYEGQQFDTIDEAMEAKVFDGKSLVDIWDEVFPQVF